MAFLHLYILCVISMISSAEDIDCGNDCYCEGNITADSFMQGDFQLRSECIGSYFQLSISSVIDLKPAINFSMTINEEINQNIKESATSPAVSIYG